MVRHTSTQPMDSVKKQLRFLKVVMAILVVLVVAQCSFWLNVFSGPVTEPHSVYKEKVLQQPRRAIAPAVSVVIEYIYDLSSN